MKVKYKQILERIDKAENTSEEILPLLYELNLLLEKNKEKFKELFVNSNDKLTKKVFEKTKNYVFNEWGNYKKNKNV